MGDSRRRLRWNIFFSHKLVTGSPGNYRIPSTSRTRAKNVTEIIEAIDPDVMGIVECMPAGKLEFFRDELLPAGYEVMTEGTKNRLNLGMLYKSDRVSVAKVSFAKDRWKDRLGNDARLRYYKWARVPLMVKVRHLSSGRELVVTVVHPKSKKTYSDDPVEQEKEALDNRKRIVAEGRRLRDILWQMAASEGVPFDRFMVMGDVNDGPSFDRYEARILRSGVEAYIGRVYIPDQVLHSFVDLSDERGVPTTPASWGAPQLDHILFTHALQHGSGLPRVVEGSGRVRSDLVNFSAGSGKATDSDHCPVQVTVSV